MIVKTFKNNNVHIRYESEYDYPVDTVAELIETISNDLDAPDVERAEILYGGNDYGYWSVSLWVNGAPRDYTIDYDDLERYNSGRRVVLQCQGKTPLFTLPPWYKDARTEGGRLYWLEKTPDDMEPFEQWGCKLMTGTTQYAPEMRLPVLFVPDGLNYYYG